MMSEMCVMEQIGTALMHKYCYVIEFVTFGDVPSTMSFVDLLSVFRNDATTPNTSPSLTISLA